MLGSVYVDTVDSVSIASYLWSVSKPIAEVYYTMLVLKSLIY